MKKLIIIICLLTFDLSCAVRKNVETPFSDPQNKPAVDDGSGSDPTQGTKFCKPDANGKFDAVSIPLQMGITASDGSSWTEGGGCVLRSIRETWATINNLEAMRFHDTDSFSAVRTINPAPNFTHLYEITYYKNAPVVNNIDWTLGWYHGFTGGTFEAPQHVNINYQKIRGSALISVWHGGIVLTKVNNSVTSIAIRNDLKSPEQSSSQNSVKSHDAVVEMIQNARSAKPDWTRLNTGLKDNPDQPDAPPTGPAPVSTTFCVKDKTGKYPPDSIASGAEQGVSWVKVLACRPVGISSIKIVAKNPMALIFKNATKAKTLTGTTVSYEKDQTFGHAIKWNMTWDYSKDSEVSYKIDPGTKDFPVWTGTVAFSEVGPGETAIEISNQMLTDVVSKSLEQNQLVSLGLLNDLIEPITGHPFQDYSIQDYSF